MIYNEGNDPGFSVSVKFIVGFGCGEDDDESGVNPAVLTDSHAGSYLGDCSKTDSEQGL